MARKFLYFIAICILIVLAGSFAYRLFGSQLMRAALVPSSNFSQQKARDTESYVAADQWIARPDISANPALWLPPGIKPEPAGKAAIFFVHPTSYLDRAHWNAPPADDSANKRAALYVQGDASAFNSVGEIWAPRYRQATFGSFLDDSKASQDAIDLAYSDVAAAFDRFVAEVDPKRPIILAGHSQGSIHVLRLLHDKVAGKPIANRIVAAYLIGWPVSIEADIPALGLPACDGPDASDCILSWLSFAEPAEPREFVAKFEESMGFTGAPRKGSKILCTNPLNGTPNSAAPAKANLGTAVPSIDLKTATMSVGNVPARCDDRGILLIGDPPSLGPYVLPGNNYHVYDYPLFWANIRADATRRMAAFSRK